MKSSVVMAVMLAAFQPAAAYYVVCMYQCVRLNTKKREI